MTMLPAATLFVLMVVNNWYIIMVRQSHLSYHDVCTHSNIAYDFSISHSLCMYVYYYRKDLHQK